MFDTISAKDEQLMQLDGILTENKSLKSKITDLNFTINDVNIRYENNIKMFEQE